MASRQPSGRQVPWRTRRVLRAGMHAWEWRVQRMVRATLCDRPAPQRDRRPWGCSSAGRAPRSHRGGQGFESPHLHQLPVLSAADWSGRPRDSPQVARRGPALYESIRRALLRAQKSGTDGRRGPHPQIGTDVGDRHRMQAELAPSHLRRDYGETQEAKRSASRSARMRSGLVRQPSQACLRRRAIVAHRKRFAIGGCGRCAISGTLVAFAKGQQEVDISGA
jgi:hypothetical protein